MKHLMTALAACAALTAGATTYHTSPSGQPLTLRAAIESATQPGDSVVLKGGVYKPQIADAMGTEKKDLYLCAFKLKSNGKEGKPITYCAADGEQPVIDMSEFTPASQRVSAFWVTGSWLHIKGIEITGVYVAPATGNTQSECWSAAGGSHNIYEQLSMHDGGGIGWYLTKGGYNLVLNCDAYCNYDSNNGGGNSDGFGCHPAAGGKGNVIRGCRSWWNSDDGFDLINASEAVRIENCWAFLNGYKPGTTSSAADGNGIKAGGYGMGTSPKSPATIPVHEVVGCVAYYNKQSGMYANHHLGGIVWLNNTSVANRKNYNMVCRKSKEEAVDVDGYGHYLLGCLSLSPRETHCANLDMTASTVANNSFAPTMTELQASDFVLCPQDRDIVVARLTAPRQPDGTFQTDLFRPTAGSPADTNSWGYTAAGQTLEEMLAAQGIQQAGITAPQADTQGGCGGPATAYLVSGQQARVAAGACADSTPGGKHRLIKPVRRHGQLTTQTLYY